MQHSIWGKGGKEDGDGVLHLHLPRLHEVVEKRGCRGEVVHDPSSDECGGYGEDGAAGAEGEMDTSSLRTTHLSRDLSYGCDMDLASSLFRVKNKRSDAEADEDLEEQVQHWRAAASVALSLDPSARTADTLPRDNRSSRRPRRGRGGDREGDASRPSSPSPGGFLPGPVSRPEAPGGGTTGLCISDDSGNDAGAGAKAKASAIARSEAAGRRRHAVAGRPPSSPSRQAVPPREGSPEDDGEERSGVFGVDTAGSSVLWDRIERSHSRGSLGSSLSEGTRRRRLERRERRERSAVRHAMRGGVKVAVAALALAALLLYLAFEADLESVDLGAWFGETSEGGREEVEADARSRKLFSFAEFLREAKADPFPQAQGNRGAVITPPLERNIRGNPQPREWRPRGS